MKNNDIDIKALFGGIPRFIHRYHVIAFVLFVLGGLSVATFFLYAAATESQAVEPTSSVQTKFDEKTITKIEGLRSNSDDLKLLEMPNGRYNPFKEG